MTLINLGDSRSIVFSPSLLTLDAMSQTPMSQAPAAEKVHVPLNSQDMCVVGNLNSQLQYNDDSKHMCVVVSNLNIQFRYNDDSKDVCVVGNRDMTPPHRVDWNHTTKKYYPGM